MVTYRIVVDPTDKEERLRKRRECERDRRASETVEQRRKALRAENKTGPGALPGVRKNEKLHYSGWVLTAGAEWPIKLQMRVRPTCSDYV